MSKSVRVGVVSSVSPEQYAVRVICEDEDDLVTDWLPILVPALKNVEPTIPDIGDSVVCLFLDDGVEGFCLGSIGGGRS